MVVDGVSTFAYTWGEVTNGDNYASTRTAPVFHFTVFKSVTA
jgi:hypothetical protein